MFHPYRVLFRAPSVASAYLSVLLSAIPLGTITLALVLGVRSWTGSLSLAGTVTALFTLGNAVGLTVQGALVDRLGDRPVVLTAGLVSGTALSALAVAGSACSAAVLAVLAATAGLAVPAITTAVRRLLPGLVPEEAARSAGYAALSVVFQLAFAVGPLLVSLAVALSGRAAPALGLSALMILGAAGVFTVAVPHQGPSAARSGGRRTGPFPVRLLLPLCAVGALSGTAAGVSTVAIPAITSAAGLAALAGLVFAASATGEIAGALLFGSREWPSTPRRQLVVALLAAAGVAALVFAVSDRPWLIAAFVGVGAAVGAPASIRLSSLLDELARPESLGLAYATLVSTGLVAAAAGTALAGRVGEGLEPRLLLLGPPLLLLAAALGATQIRPDTGRAR